MVRLFFIFYITLFTSFKVFSANISLTIPDPLPEPVLANIKSYLGDLPNAELPRISFVHSAKSNTQKALQALGYYQSKVDVEIDKTPKNDIWKITIRVILNSPTLINTVDITINGEAKNDKSFDNIANQTQLLKNNILNHGIYEQTKSTLLSLGLERGYFDGKLSTAKIAITPDNVADISIFYDSGERYTFGKIEFLNNTVNQAFIDKLVPFNTGDKYHLDQLQRLQNNLEKTQYYKNILILPQKELEQGTSLNTIPIKVSVQPAKRHYFDVGLGYATDTEFRISAGWRTPLVNQYGHRQDTRIKYSRINPTGRFNYTIPLNGSLNDVLQFRLTIENDKFGDIRSRYQSSRASRKEIQDDLNSEFYIRYLHENWDVNSVASTADYFLLGYSWSFTERSGPLIDPSDGFSQFYNIEATHTAISSETSFVKFNALWKNIKTIAPKHRLVTRAEVGYSYIDNSNVEELAPSLRFFAGGDQSIRGFAYQSIGPTLANIDLDASQQNLVIGGSRLLVASIEYQYYFTNDIRGAIFLDAGSSFNKEGIEKYYSVGPGIHYISPIGAIKLDLGYSLSEESPSWRIHLNLGAEL